MALSMNRRGELSWPNQPDRSLIAPATLRIAPATSCGSPGHVTAVSAAKRSGEALSSQPRSAWSAA